MLVDKGDQLSPLRDAASNPMVIETDFAPGTGSTVEVVFSSTLTWPASPSCSSKLADDGEATSSRSTEGTSGDEGPDHPSFRRQCSPSPRR